jgi:hypothetical protein
MIASGGVCGKLCGGAGDFRVAQGGHFDGALDVRYWPKADIRWTRADVRFRGKLTSRNAAMSF